MMRKILVPILTIVLAAAILLGLYNGLLGLRRDNEAIELHAKMQTILPGSYKFTEEAYTGEDTNIHRVWKGETGYVVETITYGYAGNIRMLIGVCNEGNVTGLQIRDMEETYGLGAEALTDWEFLAQFLRTEGDAEIGSSIDAISGATVNSKAVARSVNSAVAYVTGADVESGATSWGG
jgi:electron transport complex protein RnfG